ncbi:MAG: DUF6702 family protein [Pseudomonadota bacterium]
MRRRVSHSRCAATAALALLLACTAVAHQAREAVTRVLFNNRTGNIEVMHRFLVHDAEHAVRDIVGADADILSSEETRDQFAAYVSKRFKLRDQDDNRLELTHVGHEVEGQFLWVYAETPIPENLKALAMSHRALHDIWPDQVNLVTIERDGESRSALFGGGTPSLRIDFESSP